MKIYFVFPSKKDTELFIESGVKNLLLSYYYDMDGTKLSTLKAEHPDISIMLDSGAFSAHSLGDDITVEEYADFLKDNMKYVDHAISLDVLGDAEQSKKNYDELTKLGHKVIPVYHLMEDFKYLDYYCKTCDYICIGGAVGFKLTIRDLYNAVNRIMKRVPGHVRVHILGTTNFTLLYKYPTKLTSCDSSVISKAARFNETLTLDGIPTRTEGVQGRRASQKEIDALQRHMISRMLKVEKDINEVANRKS